MSLKLKCIAVLTFLILDCYVLSLSARLNIERRENGDIFDNPKCNSSAGVKCSCNGFINTECEDSTCKRCRCSSNYTTFLSSNDNKCVKDRRLLFIPTSPNSFSVERIGLVCMEPSSTDYIKKTNCNPTDSEQRWIWTRNNQLMHADSLRCLQEGPYAFRGSTSRFYYYSLVLQECKTTETKQLWQCLGRNNVRFRSRNKDLYMYQMRHRENIFGSNGIYRAERIRWQRFASKPKESLCSKAFGCHEFVVSAIFVTDMTLGEREISIPHTPGENLCFVMWDKLQYLGKDDWEQLPFRDEIFTIVKPNTQTYLKLDFAKATNGWTGLIVKLQFYCGASSNLTVNSTDIKCVVIKFKGTAIYPTTAPSKLFTTQKVTTTQEMLTAYKIASSGIPSTPTASEQTSGTGKSQELSPTNILTTQKVLATLNIANTEITSTLATASEQTSTDKGYPLVTKVSKIQEQSATSASSPSTLANTVLASEKRINNSFNVVIIVIVVCLVATIVLLCLVLGVVFYKRRRCSECKKRLNVARNIYAEPVINFRNSGGSNDPDSLRQGNTKSSEESASASIVLLGHGKRARNGDIEDLDDSAYLIPNETNTVSYK